jgi:hypothetical protein
MRIGILNPEPALGMASKSHGISVVIGGHGEDSLLKLNVVGKFAHQYYKIIT